MAADGTATTRTTLERLPVRFAGEPAFGPPGTTGDDEEDKRERSFHAQRVRDFLRDSLQMQHVAVLAGSGTSIGKGPPSMGDLWKRALALPEYEAMPPALKAVTEQEGIEVLLSRCDAFISIYAIVESDVASVRKFRLAAINVILEGCRNLQRDELASHVALLKKLARRRSRDSRLRLFTTNYDVAFEKAAERLGQVAIDGLSYSFPRTFNPRHFALDLVERGRDHDATAFAPGIFQYFKLHGSVDWALRGDSIGDRRIEQAEHAAPENVAFIYPTSSKYQLSYAQPHLELMTHYLGALREPNSCLIVVGFGFNDDHLSEPILSALRATPGFRLIVVTPTASQDLQTKRNPAWTKLDALARSADVDITFVGATFDDFVMAIPDLAALPPAQHLAKHLRRLLEGESP